MDPLNHGLLSAKLEAYGLDSKFSCFLQSCLTKQCQRNRIGNTFKDWENITPDVLQGLILGLFLFNIYMNNIFFHIGTSDLCNYVADSTLYTAGKSLSVW